MNLRYFPLPLLLLALIAFFLISEKIPANVSSPNERTRDSINPQALIQKRAELPSDSVQKKITLLKKALALADKKKDENARGMALNNLAEFYLRNLGKYDSAFYYANEALDISDTDEPGQNYMRALNTIGLIYSFQSKTDKAIGLYLEAYEKFEPHGPSINLAIISNNLGMNYGKKKHYREAERWYLEVIQISEQLNHAKGMLQGYNGVAAVYNELQEFDKAITYAEKSLKIAKKLNHIQAQAIGFLNIGRTAFYQQNYRKSLGNYQKAYNIFKQLNDITKQKSITRQIAFNFEKLGDFEKALYYTNLHYQLKDSILASNQAKIVEELRAKYEIEKNKREKESAELSNLQLSTINRQQSYILFGSLVLIVFALIFWILYAHQQKIKKQAASTDMALQKTQKRLQKEQQKRKEEFMAVRAQLNPHFILNVLKSVQEYIISEEKQKANETLANITKMMRKTLKNSGQDFITLKDELELVQLYLNVEKLRFEDQLNFRFSMDDHIEEEFIKLPPLLIQPYVENAVKNGIEHKNAPGKIEISAQLNEENLLEIIIEDNGIGRAAAEAFKKDNYEAYNTISVKANEERLNLIAAETKSRAGVKIIDLHDNEQNPAGTKVVLTIPIGL